MTGSKQIDIAKMITHLKHGGIIIYPTDTVYGIGVDATDTKAISNLFKLKGRRGQKAISIILKNVREIYKFCNITKQQKLILEKNLPGPFTFICKSKQKTTLDTKVIQNKKIGIRIPNHSFTRRLSRVYKNPITTTSANLSGSPSPVSISEVKKYLLNNNPIVKKLEILIIDGGKLPGTPSTVVDITKKTPKILRQGTRKFFRPK